MLRNGWEGKGSSRDAFPLLEAGSQARTTEANGSAQVIFPLAPLKEEDAFSEELREAWEYYRTPRCACSTAPSIAASRSLTQLVTYDAFNMADVFLTQPLQIVAGSAAGSKWMSDDLYARAASGDKNYHVVEGADHMSLYDVPEYVDETPPFWPPFSKSSLIVAGSLSLPFAACLAVNLCRKRGETGCRPRLFPFQGSQVQGTDVFLFF